MKKRAAEKYRPFPPVPLPDRRWPTRSIEEAPIWCSVDLRDGNQALALPMGPERKRRLFELLVRMGFKEIEVGFPSASQTDFDFVRELVEEDLVPDDVTLQVLAPARDALIERTFEALRRARSAPSSISTTRPRRSSVASSSGWIAPASTSLAVHAARTIRRLAEKSRTDVRLEYSPESFTGTELDFAVEICEAVMAVWEPSRERKVVLNLPSTVEMATPNVYADQIEWFSRTIRDRERLILSVHPHNDRGTAVAAAELALHGGRRARRGHAVRQRRAHRKRRPRDAGAEPLHAGRRARARLLRHEGAGPRGGALQPPAGAPASSLRRRARLHGVLRLASGRHPQGPRGPAPERTTRSGRCPTCPSTRRTSAGPTSP